MKNIDRTRRLGAVGACLLAGLAAIIGSGGSSTDEPIFDSNTTVELSGMLDEGGAAFPGATIKAFLVTMPATDDEQATAISDTSGHYTIEILRNRDTYLEVSNAGYATLNSRFGAFDQDTPGLNFGMILEGEAEGVIDAAFGGMAFDLADKAWLAINVEDSSGNEVDGIGVTTTPAIAGGGALNCDGSLTGADITATIPACNPARGGPMYLAYYDADAEVSITATGTADAPVAPVRVGEVTVVSIEWSGSNTVSGTLQVEVEEGGSVTTNPDVLLCIGPNTCETQVALGTRITLTATPATGSHFDDWDGCDVEIQSDRTRGICERTISDFNFIRAEFDPGAP
jgi:hypothetical protein